MTKLAILKKNFGPLQEECDISGKSLEWEPDTDLSFKDLVLKVWTWINHFIFLDLGGYSLVWKGLDQITLRFLPVLKFCELPMMKTFLTGFRLHHEAHFNCLWTKLIIRVSYFLPQLWECKEWALFFIRGFKIKFTEKVILKEIFFSRWQMIEMDIPGRKQDTWNNINYTTIYSRSKE